MTSDVQKAEYIVMGDVVESRVYDGLKLGKHLITKVESVNQQIPECLKSPLTVTLGDEFQGVASGLRQAINMIFSMEYELLKNPLKPKSYGLRYVLHEGKIESEINTQTAHGMLGPGLTHARKLLTEGGSSRIKFTISLKQEALSSRLEKIFSVIESLQKDWAPNDYPLIHKMILTDNDTQIGKEIGRHRTSVSRRRASLKIAEFLILKSLVFDLINEE